ncbi:MAG: OmpH family outer membrane protein [Myxococcota bacterium]|nr:OmpH family outer membrane protein [Myxococcota bacterium]
MSLRLPVLFAFLVLLIPSLSWAAETKIAVVDFSKALEQISDGKAAQDRLETMFKGKKAEIEQMEAQIVSLQQEYQAKSAVITDSARQDYQQRLGEAQMAYQQAYMRVDAEMQQAYVQVMESLVGKLKTHAETVAKASGYDLVLEASQGAVLYSAPAMDITAKVVAQYNSGSK